MTCACGCSFSSSSWCRCWRAQTPVSTISADTGTASVLMGACDQNQQTDGIENGLVCDRSADVWGIALTPACNLTITWPVRNNANTSLEATYATTQVSGTRVCMLP